MLAMLYALPAHPVRADELRPGYLELRQTAPNTYAMLFKIPALGEDLRLGIYVALPESTKDVTPPQAAFGNGAYIERRTISRNGGLAGQIVIIEGLSATSTDVLVRIESLGGAVQTERLAPTRIAFVVQATPGAGEVAVTYLRLGVEHILFGFDHLLFVLALIILVGDWRRVVLTVTAFTVAHSITLSLAALNIVSPPSRLIEPAIALSIVYVGTDNLLVKGGRDVRKWIAFAFGFIHGFGFASVLREMDLPARALGWSLFSFNLGVEIGQLLVVVTVASALAMLRSRSEIASRRLTFAGSIVVIVAGTFWFVQRVFFPG